MEETETTATAYAKGIVEAILFVSEKPVTIEQFRQLMDGFTPQDIKRAVQELQQDCEDQRRGMVIVEIAGGYQMLSSPHYVSYVRNFFKTRVKEKLSRPALETLAIIAYKQPVSRADVELIRGVNSDGVVNHLLNKALIKVVGRKDVPGRPFIYGTTKEFLEYFGLKSLKDMPKLDDLADELTQAALEDAKREAEGGFATDAGVLSEGESESASRVGDDGEAGEGPMDGQDAADEDTAADDNIQPEPAAESPLDLKKAMDEISHHEDEAPDPAAWRRLPSDEDGTDETETTDDVDAGVSAIVADEDEEETGS